MTGIDGSGPASVPHAEVNGLQGPPGNTFAQRTHTMVGPAPPAPSTTLYWKILLRLPVETQRSPPAFIAAPM